MGTFAEHLGQSADLQLGAARNLLRAFVAAVDRSIAPDPATVDLARELLDPPPEPPRLCDGSGLWVRVEDTDGNGVTTCRGCCRYRLTTPIGTRAVWRQIEDHTEKDT